MFRKVNEQRCAVSYPLQDNGNTIDIINRKTAWFFQKWVNRFWLL